MPIMSRRTTPRSSASGRSTGREREEENLARLPEQEQHLLVLDEERSNSEEKYKSGRESRVKTSTSRITSSSVRITTSSIVNGTTPTDLSAMNGGSSSGVSSDLILTRSQCVPGKCSAGCPLHHNRRKRKAKSRDDASTNTDSVAGDFGTFWFSLSLSQRVLMQLVECEMKVRAVTMHFRLSFIASLIAPINVCTNYRFLIIPINICTNYRFMFPAFLPVR